MRASSWAIINKKAEEARRRAYSRYFVVRGIVSLPVRPRPGKQRVLPGRHFSSVAEPRASGESQGKRRRTRRWW
ncbi:hypothetical protein NDU88_002656 [Pleurodeles waltl]|uniref:Uncharacterized protein n=1 Tax=Pleurodeles waltl TaxID=8319 RepID=A0AAV7NMK7_PLEWA|nr:hypothetical protein NDU88_002656 [Pleurodeles waltl]